MALSAAFRERMEQMDQVRSERLALLQSEKELQATKSQILASKHTNIRSMEQRCMMLDQKLATQSLKISILKSEFDSLDSTYNSVLQRLRILKHEVEELEETEKERNRFYDEKTSEMKAFKDDEQSFVVECRIRVEELRDELNETMLTKAVATECKTTFFNISASSIVRNGLVIRETSESSV